MAMLRRFRSHLAAISVGRPVKSTTTISSSSMGSSMMSSSTTSNSLGQKNNAKNVVPELGIERSSSGTNKHQQQRQQKTPRFFFWTLNHSDKKAKKSVGTSSDASTPRTPDSSRSVSFEGAESWPWIDDVVPGEEFCSSDTECLVVC